MGEAQSAQYMRCRWTHRVAQAAVVAQTLAAELGGLAQAVITGGIGEHPRVQLQIAVKAIGTQVQVSTLNSVLPRRLGGKHCTRGTYAVCLI